MKKRFCMSQRSDILFVDPKTLIINTEREVRLFGFHYVQYQFFRLIIE